MTKKKITVAVLMGGPSAEHEVSLATGKTVLEALDKDKYELIPILITKEAEWFVVSEDVRLEAAQALKRLKSLSVDVVFIALHGTFGEDGTIQRILENAGIAYTGSGAAASALAMNKHKSGQLFASHGLKVPVYVHFSKEEWNQEEWKALDAIRHLIFPCVVKPVALGSSVGVSLVDTIEQLAEAADRVFACDAGLIIQERVFGVEVTCGVLDKGGKEKPVALPPTEIAPKSSFFDYDAKYKQGATEEITPARLPSEVIQAVQETALKAHKILGCSGMSRTDMIVVGNDIFILETNTIPGMTATSLYPQAATAAGIPFPHVLDSIIDAAFLK